MWKIYEDRKAIKQIDSIPVDILKKYEKWRDIVMVSGTEGLKRIKGFQDEALKGNWKGFRSSRLSIQYRVIYKVEGEQFYVKVVKVTPHNYRR